MTFVESAVIVTESEPPLQLELDEGATSDQHEEAMALESEAEPTQPESSEPVVSPKE